MDIDFSLEVKHLWQYERPYKVTLTRGARGVYRWEIEVRGGDAVDVADNIGWLDELLRKKYASIEPTKEEE